MNQDMLSPVDDELAEIVQDLIAQTQAFDGFDERKIDRESLICAVQVNFKTRNEQHQAFSRNISAVGIGLITDVEMPLNQSAELSIERFDGTSIKLTATCRWCTSYGPNWHLSGFEFRSLVGIRRF